MMKFHSLLLIILSLLFLLATTKSQDFPVGSCGDQAGGALCAPGFCCSIWGWCGNTPDYCDAQNCQTQCPPPPSPPPPPPSPPPPSPPPPSPPFPIPVGSCGEQGGGALCAPGFCCSNLGWCGNTPDFCDPQNCQSQCPPPPSPPPPPPPQQIDCGINHGGALCPEGMCCNFFGFCSDLSLAMCNSGNCISQCGQPPICGVDAGGALCPPDDCCTIAGLCTHRTQFNMCNLPKYCQSGCAFESRISMLKATS